MCIIYNRDLVEYILVPVMVTGFKQEKMFQFFLSSDVMIPLVSSQKRERQLLSFPKLKETFFFSPLTFVLNRIEDKSAVKADGKEKPPIHSSYHFVQIITLLYSILFEIDWLTLYTCREMNYNDGEY